VLDALESRIATMRVEVFPEVMGRLGPDGVTLIFLVGRQGD
jgi:hypothetical protein